MTESRSGKTCTTWVRRLISRRLATIPAGRRRPDRLPPSDGDPHPKNLISSSMDQTLCQSPSSKQVNARMSARVVSRWSNASDSFPST